MRNRLVVLIAGLIFALTTMVVSGATAAPPAPGSIWGTWHVDLVPEEGDPRSGDVSIWPKMAATCQRTAKGYCIFRWLPADNGGFEAYGSPGHQDGRFLAPRSATTGIGFMTLEQSYWPNTFYLEQLLGNGTMFSGAYFLSGEPKGTSRWKHLTTTIDRIEISPLGRGWYKPGGTSYAPGDRLRAKGKFNASHWSEYNTLRGNRPTFTVRIFGSNVAAVRAVELPYAPGFEPFNPDLLKDEAGRVIGVRMEIALWPGATPGIKRLLINGEEHEIEIVADGYVAGPEQDRCGPEYFEQLRQLATARLARFERESAVIAGPDPKFRNFKETAYVRSGYVSFDENEDILKIESVVAEAIAGNGPDLWLSNTRELLLVRYRSLIQAYLAAEYRAEGCLNPVDFYKLNSLISNRIGEITHPRLRDLGLMTARSAELAKKYSRIVREKIYATGVNWLDLARGKALTFEQTEALRLSMNKFKQEMLEAAQAGTKLTRQEVAARIREAYVSAGIPDDKIPDGVEATNLEIGIISWVAQATYDVMADDTGLSRVGGMASTALGAWGLVNSMADITFAVFDYGTLTGVEKADMPLALALMQDAAHMENLVWRYKAFREQVYELDGDLTAML